MLNVDPTTRVETAATDRNWGRLGSISPEAASPVANKARSGKRKEGLSNDEFSSFLGALNRSDSRPSMWFVMHIASPG